MSQTVGTLLLHHGDTVHKRFTPFVSSFRYRVAMIELDIDRLADADAQCRLFSVERTSLYSFCRKDHGGLKPQALRPWAEAELHKAGIVPPGGPIRLITFPRHLFYKFAPLSLWIAMDTSDVPAAILYEVRNTFGEKHTYVARLDGGWSRHEAPKSFHVSPFFDVSGKYSFSLQYQPGGLRLGVSTVKDGVPVHSATLATQAAPATDSALAMTALKMPLSSIGVTLGIHWEALKLWTKGARYHQRPRRSEPEPTLAAGTRQGGSG